MAQNWAVKLYCSRAWLKCRASFIAERQRIDGGMCQNCGERLGEIAHHWPVPLTPSNVGDAEVALCHGNLRWVCRECHDKYPGHGVRKPLTSSVSFDADGDVIPPYSDPQERPVLTAAPGRGGTWVMCGTPQSWGKWV